MPAASAHFTDFAPAAETRGASRPSLVSRAFRAIHDAQTRRAEREIARFIESRGGRMTDDLERSIERHFV